MYNKEIPKQVWALCQRVASLVYPGNVPPSPAYQNAVARLMFMTSAHESGGFLYRRQRGMGGKGWIGAFGLFQTEWAAVVDNLAYLARHPEIVARCIGMLPQVSQALLNDALANVEDLQAQHRAGGAAPPLKVALLTQLTYPDGDTLAAIFCRVHYLRQPGAIPGDEEGQALYAKKYYNTSAGAATPGVYASAFRRWFAVATDNREEITNVPKPLPENHLNHPDGCTVPRPN